MDIPAGEVVQERLGAGQGTLLPLDKVHGLAVQIARPVCLDLGRTVRSRQTADSRQTERQVTCMIPPTVWDMTRSWTNSNE